MMGEAKINLEIIREYFIEVVEGWARPISSGEIIAVKEIASLPVITVPVADADQLAYSGMQKRECHLNCRFVSENDPEKQTHRILGWVPFEDCYVLHSIINQRGQNLCITPNEEGSTSIRFIPDKTIIDINTGHEEWRYERKGFQIFNGVRINPEKIIKQSLRCKELLLTDMNPYEAVQVGLGISPGR